MNKYLWIFLSSASDTLIICILTATRPVKTCQWNANVACSNVEHSSQLVHGPLHTRSQLIELKRFSCPVSHSQIITRYLVIASETWHERLNQLLERLITFFHVYVYVQSTSPAHELPININASVFQTFSSGRSAPNNLLYGRTHRRVLSHCPIHKAKVWHMCEHILHVYPRIIKVVCNYNFPNAMTSICYLAGKILLVYVGITVIVCK
jgi:hypothetical protein